MLIEGFFLAIAIVHHTTARSEWEGSNWTDGDGDGLVDFDRLATVPPNFRVRFIIYIDPPLLTGIFDPSLTHRNFRSRKSRMRGRRFTTRRFVPFNFT